MATRTVAKDIITLRGFAAIISEFFEIRYAANNFMTVKKYGLPMLLTEYEGVKSFLANLTTQLSELLEAGKLQRVVLVIMSKATSEVLERWNFNIETNSEVVENGWVT
uniref:HORMA domain-containing protein n=1 Tax=Glycine max TaxID=3847 RepID=K7MGY1_SOYBN